MMGKKGRAGGRTSYLEVKPSGEEGKVEAERSLFLSKYLPSSKFPSPLQSPETTLETYCCPTIRAGSIWGEISTLSHFPQGTRISVLSKLPSLLLVS